MQPFTKTYKKGMNLFHENDRSRELFLIQSGSVKVYRRINAKEVELAVLTKGALVGEMALIDGKPRSASAMTLEDSTVTIIDANAFLEKVAETPPWFLRVIKTVSEKIRVANQRLEMAYARNYSVSIALALHYLFARGGASSALDCSETINFCSRLLCLSAQRCTEVIDKLQREGLLSITNGAMRLIDARRFHDYCFYLRSRDRNLFDNIKPLSDRALATLSALRGRIELGSSYLDKTADFSVSDLGAGVLGSADQSAKQAIISELRDASIICAIKGQAPAGAQEGNAPSAYCIDRAVFEKYYLHTTFSSIMES